MTYIHKIYYWDINMPIFALAHSYLCIWQICWDTSRAVEVMGQARGSTGGDMEPFFDLNSHISNHRTLTTELRLEKRNCKRSLQDPTVISVTLKYLGHSRFLSSEPGLNSPRFLQAVQMLAQCQKNEDESIRATAAVLTAQTT